MDHRLPIPHRHEAPNAGRQSPDGPHTLSAEEADLAMRMALALVLRLDGGHWLAHRGQFGSGTPPYGWNAAPAEPQWIARSAAPWPREPSQGAFRAQPVRGETRPAPLDREKRESPLPVPGNSRRVAETALPGISARVSTRFGQTGGEPQTDRERRQLACVRAPARDGTGRAVKDAGALTLRPASVRRPGQRSGALKASEDFARLLRELIAEKPADDALVSGAPASPPEAGRPTVSWQEWLRQVEERRAASSPPVTAERDPARIVRPRRHPLHRADVPTVRAEGDDCAPRGSSHALLPQPGAHCDPGPPLLAETPVEWILADELDGELLPGRVGQEGDVASALRCDASLPGASTGVEGSVGGIVTAVCGTFSGPGLDAVTEGEGAAPPLPVTAPANDASDAAPRHRKDEAPVDVAAGSAVSLPGTEHDTVPEAPESAPAPAVIRLSQTDGGAAAWGLANLLGALTGGIVTRVPAHGLSEEADDDAALQSGPDDGAPSDREDDAHDEEPSNSAVPCDSDRSAPPADSAPADCNVVDSDSADSDPADSGPVDSVPLASNATGSGHSSSSEVPSNVGEGLGGRGRKTPLVFVSAELLHPQESAPLASPRGDEDLRGEDHPEAPQPTPPAPARPTPQGPNDRAAHAGDRLSGTDASAEAAPRTRETLLKQMRRVWLGPAFKRSPHTVLAVSLRGAAAAPPSGSALLMVERGREALRTALETLGEVHALGDTAFGILLADHALPQAERLAQTLKDAVDTRSAEHPAAPSVFAAGLAALHREEDPTAALCLAEQCLWLAEQSVESTIVTSADPRVRQSRRRNA